MSGDRGLLAAVAAVVVAMATWSGSVLADEPWQLGVQWSLSFGGERAGVQQLDAGTALRVPVLIENWAGEQASPYSGLQFRSDSGWRPALAGVAWQPLRPQGLSAETDSDEDGRSGVWIGLAITGGVLAALALGGNSVEVNGGSVEARSGSGNGATDENTCVGPNLDNPEHYDTDCIDG